MLSFCIIVAITTIATIIWQNTVALRKISEELIRSREQGNYLKLKIDEIDRKLDLLFFEDFKKGRF